MSYRTVNSYNHEVLTENIFSDKQLFHDCLICLRANQTTWANNKRDFLMPARLVHASQFPTFPSASTTCLGTLAWKLQCTQGLVVDKWVPEGRVVTNWGHSILSTCCSVPAGCRLAEPPHSHPFHSPHCRTTHTSLDSWIQNIHVTRSWEFWVYSFNFVPLFQRINYDIINS